MVPAATWHNSSHTGPFGSLTVYFRLCFCNQEIRCETRWVLPREAQRRLRRRSDLNALPRAARDKQSASCARQLKALTKLNYSRPPGALAALCAASFFMLADFILRPERPAAFRTFVRSRSRSCSCHGRLLPYIKAPALKLGNLQFL